MSQEDVDTVRVAYDVAYVQRSVEGLRDHVADDFVWHSRPEWPGKSTYGLHEMTSLWADLDETFSEYQLVPTAFEELAPGYVLVTLEQSACLRESETRVKTTLWHLWRVDNVAREAWALSSRAEALEAAGLSE